MHEFGVEGLGLFVVAVSCFGGLIQAAVQAFIRRGSRYCIESLGEYVVRAKVERSELRCRICDSAALREYGTVNGYAIQKCPECGFGQTNVKADDIKSLYDGAYFAGENAGACQSASDEIKLGYKVWADRFIPGDCAAVLEVGPGPSAMLGRYLVSTRSPMSYAAVEISEFASKAIAAHGFEVHTGTIDDPAVSAICEGRFDAILATEVIEHVLDARKFADAIFRGLKPGGTLCLTTGNFDGLRARLNGLSWYYLNPPAHVCYYSPRSITRLLCDAGFTSIHVDCVGLNYLAVASKYPLPGLLPMVRLSRISTGMTVTARKP